MKSNITIFGSICFILLAFIFPTSILNAQSWKWGSEGKGSIYLFSGGGAIATNKDGDAFIYGYYNVSIVFGTDTLTNIGYDDVYLIKYDSNGNITWSTQPTLGDPSSAVIGGIEHIDNAENIYVTGKLFDTVYFGSFKLFDLYPPNGTFFLEKYNSNGTVLWVIEPNVYPYAVSYPSMATDNSDNVFITGSSLDSNFQSKYIVVKYNSNGNLLWARNSEWATLMGGSYGNSVTTDKSGNSYVTGDFLRGSASFGPDTLTTKLRYNAYLVKYDSNGNFQWVKNPTGRDSATGYNYGTAVATDNSGNIYEAGYFMDTVTFGSYTLYAPVGITEVFLVKYNTNGNVMWATGSLGGYISRPTSICSDEFGHVYLGGIAIGNITFGSVAFHPIDSTIEYYSFLIKLDTSGKILCGSLLNNGAGDIATSLGIASDPTGKYVYLSANTVRGDTVIAGPDTLVANYSGNTPYVTRWQPCNNIETNINPIPNKSTVTVFPNPNNGSFILSISNVNEKCNVEIFNIFGENIYSIKLNSNSTEINMRGQPQGVYFYRVQKGNGDLIGNGKLVIEK